MCLTTVIFNVSIALKPLFKLLCNFYGMSQVVYSMQMAYINLMAIDARERISVVVMSCAHDMHMKNPNPTWYKILIIQRI